LSPGLQSNRVTTGRTIASWIDAAWLPLAALISAAIAVLNIRAEHRFHTIEKHLVFNRTSAS